MDSKILSLLVSTSSSSSSSEDDVFWSFLTSNTDTFKNYFDENSTKNFIGDTVLNYTDYEFRQQFRVTRQIAKQVTDRFANSRHFRKKPRSSRKHYISAQIHCLSFLLFVGSKKSYFEVTQIFKLSPSVAYRVLTSFLEFLLEISCEYIQMPITRDERTENSQAFQKVAGLKNVLGCIDMCYIPLRTHSTKLPATHINPFGQPSVTLQAICDANSKFLNVFVGATGKCHESDIFNMSNIAREIPQICGREFHILGDLTYPLREYLLTPFKESDDMTSQQRIFNEKQFNTKIITENAFSLLRKRFRQLTQLDCFTVMQMSKIVLGCCVLHNLCIDQNDMWLDDEDNNDPEEQLKQFIVFDREEQAGEEVAVDTEVSMLDAALFQKGKVKRDNIIKLF